MKYLSIIITSLLFSTIVSAQLKYDDGAIVTTGQDFVTVRAWNHTNLTYFFSKWNN